MIQFTKALRVQRSSRGYVTVTVRGTTIVVTRCIPEATKAAIERMSYEDHVKPWQEAMAKVEEAAIEEARVRCKRWRGR